MTTEETGWIEGLAIAIYDRHFHRLSAEHQHELLGKLASKLKQPEIEEPEPKKPEMKEEDVALLHFMLNQPIDLLWSLIPNSKGPTGKDKGLKVRAMVCIGNREITQIGQFVQQTEKELLRWHNFGAKTLDAMKQALAAFSHQCGVQIEIGMDVRRWCP